MNELLDILMVGLPWMLFLYLFFVPSSVYINGEPLNNRWLRITVGPIILCFLFVTSVVLMLVGIALMFLKILETCNNFVFGKKPFKSLCGKTKNFIR